MLHIPEHTVPQNLSLMKYAVTCVSQGYAKMLFALIRDIPTLSLRNLVGRKALLGLL